MKIRKMMLADLKQVCLIEKEIFSQPWNERDFQSAILNKNNIYLAADVDDEIVGYCGCWGVAGEGNIYNVAVKKEYRGRYIGKEMMRELLYLSKQRGITSFTLEVRAGNEPAISLYRSLGFEPAGIRKDFYTGPKEDAVIMWLYRIQ